MSYDVMVGGSKKEPNYTSNLRDLLYNHIPNTGKGGGLHELHETRNEQVVSVLTNFIVSMTKEMNELGVEAMKAKYEPENKWGNIEGLLMFVSTIIIEAAMNPGETTTISA